nr:hypothetical protein [uncultured Methanoregula sp.]
MLAAARSVGTIKRRISADRKYILGVRWDTSNPSPALTRVDLNGNPIGDLPFSLDDHPTFSKIRRCTIIPGSNPKFGQNPRGDGLDLTGANGEVMVSKPKIWVNSGQSGNYLYWWISPFAWPGFEPFYSHCQRGGKWRDTIYGGAFEACDLGGGANRKLGSRTNQTPMTGASETFTLTNAETYANHHGPGWGITNFWTQNYDQLLYLIDYANWDSQTVLGRGIVDKASGSGFAGEKTGFGNINSRLARNGTGTGAGTNGLTSIAWRGKENPHGNTWEFIIGFNSVNTAYRILRRDGKGTPAETLAAGSYESSVAAPITTSSSPYYVYNYVKGILYEPLTKYGFIPNNITGGSAGTYLTDYFYSHYYGATCVLLVGGTWYSGSVAGLAYRHSYNAVGNSDRSIGARLEYKPQE